MNSDTEQLSISEQITILEKEIEKLAEDIAECSRRADELLRREAEGEGPFAAEIFQAKRDKLQLSTEVQIRKVRINKLKLGYT